jgi:hypothetical protein
MRPEWLRPGGAAAMRSAALGSAPPCGTSGQPRLALPSGTRRFWTRATMCTTSTSSTVLCSSEARRCCNAAATRKIRSLFARAAATSLLVQATCSRTGLRRACRPPERVRACVCLYFGRMCSRELPVVCQCELLCVCVASSARGNVHDFAPIPYGTALHRCAAWLSGNILQRQASPGWTLTSSSKMSCTATSTQAQSFWRCSGPAASKQKNKQKNKQRKQTTRKTSHPPAQSTHARTRECARLPAHVRPWRCTLRRAFTHHRANANVRNPCVIPATRRSPKRSARQEWGRPGLACCVVAR